MRRSDLGLNFGPGTSMRCTFEGMDWMRRGLLSLVGLALVNVASAARILVPMDDSQTNHLKAYGVAFWVLENGVEVEWLLNYRGGSFLMPNIPEIQNECVIRGVSHQVIADVQAAQILQEVADPEVNMERVKLEVTPNIAVYSPDGKQPWDDAVTLVLTYAEIPYDVVYDEQILTGELPKYDCCTCTTRISRGSTANFTGHTEALPGTKRRWNAKAPQPNTWASKR